MDGKKEYLDSVKRHFGELTPYALKSLWREICGSEAFKSEDFFEDYLMVVNGWAERRKIDSSDAMGFAMDTVSDLAYNLPRDGLTAGRIYYYLTNNCDCDDYLYRLLGELKDYLSEARLNNIVKQIQKVFDGDYAKSLLVDFAPDED